MLEFRRHVHLKMKMKNIYIPWNKNLTKETDERVRMVSEKVSKTRIRLFKEGKLIHPTKGKKRPDVVIRLKKNNPMKNPETVEKMRKKILQLHKDGKYEHTYKNKERNKKIGLAHKNKMVSKTTRKKQSIARKGKSFEERCGSKDKAEKWREKVRKNSKNLWTLDKMKELRKYQHIRPNKPEKIMINLINNNNLPFNYVGDGTIWVGKFNPDFLSKNPKHIIEMFGDYWHNLPDVMVRDKERLKTYSKYGYKTLIVWEHELKNTNQVINKIKGFIK